MECIYNKEDANVRHEHPGMMIRMELPPQQEPEYNLPPQPMVNPPMPIPIQEAPIQQVPIQGIPYKSINVNNIQIEDFPIQTINRQQSSMGYPSDFSKPKDQELAGNLRSYPLQMESFQPETPGDNPQPQVDTYQIRASAIQEYQDHGQEYNPNTIKLSDD
jgi:hypothetical protein